MEPSADRRRAASDASVPPGITSTVGSRLPADLLVVHAGELATLAGRPAPRLGTALGDPGVIRDGAVAAAGGRIVAVGPTQEVAGRCPPAPGAAVIDAAGRLVTPGLVDPHTHLVFSGQRAGEFAMRLRGARYEEILAAGGGILSTVRATREASEADLIALGAARLDRMLAHGTTTVEAKSGYGLSLADELKILRATAELRRRHAVEIVPTFLGAHVVPAERRADPEAYVREVCGEMLPAVAAEGLAAYCDVFCEAGAFSVAQSRRILEAAARLGLGLKVHADQLSASGGARLAAEMGAASADHLEHTPPDDLVRMAARGVTAGLLPGATFFLLQQRYADARAMVEAGVPVALATDFNPGSSPTMSMQMAMALACAGMRLTPAEVLSAATINGAHSIGAADEAGSLEPGKRADLVVWGVGSVDELPLHFGTNMADVVVKEGRVVIGGGRTYGT